MELIVNIKKKLRNFDLVADFKVVDQVFALLGASGCGKSMTLKCIAGIEKPDEGFISLNGRVLYDSKKKINLPPQQRNVGYLFQNYALFPNMTIAQNIAFVANGTKEEKQKKVAANIKRFALDGLENAYPSQLSGGQQQRAAFARIVAADSELLMLDEPFSALDNYLKWQLELEFMEILKSYGGAAILVSHDRGEVFRLADRIGVMNKGHIEAVNEKHQLFANPKTLAATLLTGCKNLSTAKTLSNRKVLAEEWGLELTTDSDIPGNISYIGLRAHYFEQVGLEQAGKQPNTFRMEIIQTIEDTFSYLLMIRKEGTNCKPIRWEIEKAAYEHIQNNVVAIHFPEDKFMLLEK